MKKVLRYGHRGACGHAPENTLLSMQKALDLKVAGFEFDIQLSKDGEPIVIHDETLNRTTNGVGLVSDYTYKQLQEFDAGKGEKIPHLNDVFDFVDKRCELLIELKADAADVVARHISQAIAKGWDYEQILVVSFNHLQLAHIRRLNRKIRTGALLVGIPVSLAAIAEEAGCYAINPGVYHLNRELIEDAHKRRLKVFTWTANDPRTIAKAKALGVDGIFSDYPELV